MFKIIVIFMGILTVLVSTSCASRYPRNLNVSETFNTGIKLAHSFEPNWDFKRKLRMCFLLESSLGDVQPIVTGGTNNKIYDQYNLKELLDLLNPNDCTNRKIVVISEINTQKQIHPMKLRLSFYDAQVIVYSSVNCNDSTISLNANSKQSIKINEFHSSDEGFALVSASILLALKTALFNIENQYEDLLSKNCKVL